MTEWCEVVVFFWFALTYFFLSEKVAQWKRAALSDKVESPANMLCLSRSAREYWAKGLMALKAVAISQDRTQMTVQFFWLDRKTRRRNRVSLLEAPDQILNIGDSSPGNTGGIKLWNSRTGESIKSGDLLTLKTDDPVQNPLPDWEIMEMQWYLQLAAAAGGTRKGGDTGDPEGAYSEDDTDTEDDDSGYSDEDSSD